MTRDKRCVRIKKENFTLYRRITMYQNRTKSPLTIRFRCPSYIGGPWGERKRAESKGDINKRQSYSSERGRIWKSEWWLRKGPHALSSLPTP